MRVLCRIDHKLPRDFFKQLQSLGVLLFREQVDLQIQAALRQE